MKPVVIAHSTVNGGAEVYLARLYAQMAQKGQKPHLIGNLPGWSETGLPQSSIELGPKWSRRTIVQGHLRAPWERVRLMDVLSRLDSPSYFHLQFKRE